MTYKAVIFDFDYTLGDATDAIFAGFTHGFTQMGYPVPQREAVRHTVGMLLEDAFTQLTGNGVASDRARFRGLFSQVARPLQRQGVPLCAGARELLLALQGAGVLTAVVSTKHSSTLNEIFSAHGLSKVFALVIGGDSVERPKPDPEGLNAALERLGLDTAEVLFCGDTTIDAETARNAGCDFCAVLNGTTPASAFEAYPHRHIAPDLPNLHHWLGLSLLQKNSSLGM